jgi:hypothetical protein
MLIPMAKWYDNAHMIDNTNTDIIVSYSTYTEHLCIFVFVLSEPLSKKIYFLPE